MNGDNHPVGSPSGESGRAKIDYAELRQKAERATGDLWIAQPIATEGEEAGSVFIIADNLGGLVASANAWPTEIDDGNFARVEANASYIVAAQPSTVLALLDRIEELEAAVRDIADATDPDNPESYRRDDREGCLDTVHAIARKALSGEKKP